MGFGDLGIWGSEDFVIFGCGAFRFGIFGLWELVGSGFGDLRVLGFRGEATGSHPEPTESFG